MSKETEGPVFDTCVCESNNWHRNIKADIKWCARCGSYRTSHSTKWHIPLDRAGDLSYDVKKIFSEEATTKTGKKKI